MLDWQKYMEIADKFQVKARYEDREDLRQDIILRLAEVELKYNGSGKTLSVGGMLRVASYTVMEYWRSIMRFPAVTSLNETVDGSDGDETELYQMLADDKAIDVEDWLDAKLWLHKAPFRLVKIAYKKVAGYALTDRERNYLYQQRKKLKKVWQSSNILARFWHYSSERMKPLAGVLPMPAGCGSAKALDN